MAARSPMVVIHQAHAGIRRSALRRQLQSVASGNSTSLSVDLDQSGADVGAAIEEITNHLPIESMHVQRLVFAFKRSGTADRVVERVRVRHCSRGSASTGPSNTIWLLLGP